MKDTGFFRVPRCVWDDHYFDDAHRYSKREAWFDLVRLARGVANGIERSQFQVSNVDISKRWSWPEVSVREFIANRIRAGWLRLIQASDRASHRPAIYAVVNFDEMYNGRKSKSASNPGPTLFCDGSRDGIRERKPTLCANSSECSAMGPAMVSANYKEERTKESDLKGRRLINQSSLQWPQDERSQVSTIVTRYQLDELTATAVLYIGLARNRNVGKSGPIRSIEYFRNIVSELEDAIYHGGKLSETYMTYLRAKATENPEGVLK